MHFLDASTYHGCQHQIPNQIYVENSTGFWKHSVISPPQKECHSSLLHSQAEEKVELALNTSQSQRSSVASWKQMASCSCRSQFGSANSDSDFCIPNNEEKLSKTKIKTKWETQQPALSTNYYGTLYIHSHYFTQSQIWNWKMQNVGNRKRNTSNQRENIE